ncbi:MAG: hypothetical protein WCK78_04400 [Paludibacter sp.]
MGTLFDEIEVVQKKPVGNPYHSRRGRYTDKKTAAKEKAEKRADVAENSLAYIKSCYFALGEQLSRVLRQNEKQKAEIEQLKCELSSYRNKTA